jgi:hypothetical protein
LIFFFLFEIGPFIVIIVIQLELVSKELNHWAAILRDHPKVIQLLGH